MRGSADLVGVSWELFDAFGPHDEIAGRVRRYAERVGVSWSSVLYTGEPEAMFSALDMSFERIPQTRVIGPDGAVLHEVHGPMDEAALDKIRSLLGAS